MVGFPTQMAQMESFNGTPQSKMDDSGAPLGFFGHLQILCAPNGRTAGSRLTRMRRRSCRISVAHLNVGQSWSPSLVLWLFLASSTDGEKRLPEVASKKNRGFIQSNKELIKEEQAQPHLRPCREKAKSW